MSKENDFPIDSVVRLTQKSEDQMPTHKGKYFTIIGYHGVYLHCKWANRKYLFLPEEVQIISKSKTNLT